MIKKIAIVGGGTAGLVAALILKTRFPKFQIDIIRSKKLGIIGVGEGSTEHWQDFMSFVGLNTAEMIKTTDATFKIGILFKDWGVPDYMHSIQDGYNLVLGQYPYIYGKLIGENNNSNALSGKLFWENKINKWYVENNQSPVAQYHFNTFKLNEFLSRHAIERGITFFDDEIVDVTLNELGEIDTINSIDVTYNYDFYIDCSGFKKILISKLGSKWVSHNEYLKTNSVIVFQTPDTENYNMWSLAQAMKYGWMFRTPTWSRWGNGYIFDSEFITADQAKQEVEDFLGHTIEVGNHIKFDPGALDKAWIKNCCAIGLSSSFVEPLEASSIGTTIQQSFMLMHRLVNYNQEVIDRYNKSVNDIVYNIRDFIVLHFITKRRDTEFWKKVANVKLPESLQKQLEIWKYKLPIKEDFNHVTDYILFKELHFLMILHGLKLFDINSIHDEFNSLDIFVQKDAEKVIASLEDFYSLENTNTITHKELLKIIRNKI